MAGETQECARRARLGLAIVICDFNGWDQTHRCLAALRRSRLQGFDTFVVDHGTTETTAKGLAEGFPEVHRLPASPDLWWAGATNAGIRAALAQGATRVMLLNNDCYLEDDTLRVLMEHSRRHPDTIIAPVQVSAETGEYVSIAPRDNLLLGFPTIHGPRRIDEEMKAQGLVPTRLIGGGRGVVIPANVFALVGLLDEDRLPHYYADHDFYLRCRASGVPLRVAVGTRVCVDQSRTSLAHDMDRLTWRQMRESLRNRRSHRSVAAVTALFKKHYPLRRLYGLGVALYITRYFAVYGARRALLAAKRKW
jgi:GT2 family glycosyltransferase